MGVRCKGQTVRHGDASTVIIFITQEMKNTTPDNSDLIVQDERILNPDRIVTEVKQSEEWEAVEMNILKIGIQQGIEQGKEQNLKEIIANMLIHKVPDSDICAYTGCTPEFIDVVRKGTDA